MPWNFKTVLSHGRIGQFAASSFKKPLRAELSGILQGRHLEHDIDCRSIRSEDGGGLDRLESRVLSVPALSPEAVPLDIVALRHLDPGEERLRDALFLLVERGALCGIDFRRRLF